MKRTGNKGKGEALHALLGGPAPDIGGDMSQASIKANPEARDPESALDPTEVLRGLGLPIRQLDLTGGIEFKMLMERELSAGQKNYGRILGWMHVSAAVVYLLAAIAFLFVVIFRDVRPFPLFWDPLRYSSLGQEWVVALERLGPGIRIDWALLVNLPVFSFFHAILFYGPVLDANLRFIFFYQFNPIRWIFHGVFGGLTLAYFAVVMGVSHVVVFVSLLAFVLFGAAFVLYNEMVNRPNIYTVVAGDDDASLRAKYPALSVLDSQKAIKDGYFILPAVVSPYPILAAIVSLLLYLGIASAYFWVTVADHSSQVAWYAGIAWGVAIVTAALLAILNTMRLIFNIRLVQNYFYLDTAHYFVEFFFMIGAGIVQAGLAASH